VGRAWRWWTDGRLKFTGCFGLQVADWRASTEGLKVKIILCRRGYVERGITSSRLEVEAELCRWFVRQDTRSRTLSELYSSLFLSFLLLSLICYY
jgi:hypothetical protein